MNATAYLEGWHRKYLEIRYWLDLPTKLKNFFLCHTLLDFSKTFGNYDKACVRNLIYANFIFAYYSFLSILILYIHILYKEYTAFVTVIFAPAYKTKVSKTSVLNIYMSAVEGTKDGFMNLAYVLWYKNYTHAAVLHFVAYIVATTLYLRHNCEPYK